MIISYLLWYWVYCSRVLLWCTSGGNGFALFVLLQVVILRVVLGGVVKWWSV